jgi:hypothetical protein
MMEIYDAQTVSLTQFKKIKGKERYPINSVSIDKTYLSRWDQ